MWLFRTCVAAEFWRPGIGDPTALGWITVAGYFIAAITCVLARRAAQRNELGLPTQHTWTLLSATLLALGINKQLDLQTLLTDIGRLVARQEGWYSQRRPVQALFIALLIVVCALGIWWCWRRVRHSPIEIKFAIAGLVMLILYAVVRAVSFHHVDAMLGMRWMDMRLSWLIELGGIACIAMSSASFALAGERHQTLRDEIPPSDALRSLAATMRHDRPQRR
jgi:hypothetical protein